MSDNVVATATSSAAPATATDLSDDEGIKKHRFSPAVHALLFVLLGMLVTLVLIAAWPLSEILANTVPTPRP
ncbi:hypothetical protein [Kytococcus schroeteri]|uniref:Uncharacterized protein n=1 Tax=Kytococcus schroeteri TaxID=138300 RepID=A0A2I1P8G4_9MICO|nr:hypothetical protein [Kytococcus schroeteri]PKZ40919.1 hypothetical protein CYJ76_10365 [Kytococcus schroeteri]